MTPIGTPPLRILGACIQDFIDCALRHILDGGMQLDGGAQEKAFSTQNRKIFLQNCGGEYPENAVTGEEKREPE